jgi:hypothetical protein
MFTTKSQGNRLAEPYLEEYEVYTQPVPCELEFTDITNNKFMKEKGK